MSRIQLRRDTAADWTAANPVLAPGELGVELDTGLLKFGDGSTAWSGLAYLASPGAGVNTVDGLSGTVDLTGKYAQLANNLADLADVATARNNLGVGAFLTPEQFGAVGDGVTDDSAALQAMLTATTTAGNPLVLMSAGKTYNFATTLSVPWPCVVRGAGRGRTNLTYTGSGAALQMWNPGTSEQKLNVTLSDFTLNAATASTGINGKGMTAGLIERVEIVGVASTTTIPSGTVGVLLDGSYGVSIGAWHNTIRDCNLSGWDAGVKATGISGAGQANMNRVVDTRMTWFNKGVWVDVGDTVVVKGCSFTSSATGAVGVYTNDTITRIEENRFESVDICVQVASSGSRAVIQGNSLNGTIGVQLDAGSSSCTVGPNENISATPIIDNAASSSSGTSLHYYTGQLVPILFVHTNITASMTNVQVPLPGASGITLAMIGKAYQIRGVSARLQSASTAGTLTLKPTISSTPSSTLSATLTGASTTSMFQAMGKDANAGTSSVGVQVSTTSGFLPTGGQLSVIVWIEFTPA